MLDDDELDILCDKPYKDLTSLERDECLKRVRKQCGLAVQREIRKADEDTEETSVNEMVKAITEESAPWVSSEQAAKPAQKKRGRKPSGTRTVRAIPEREDRTEAKDPAETPIEEPAADPAGKPTSEHVSEAGASAIIADNAWTAKHGSAFTAIDVAIGALQVAQDELRGRHADTARSMVSSAVMQASVALAVMDR